MTKYLLRQVQHNVEGLSKTKCGICGIGSNEEEDTEEYIEDGQTPRPESGEERSLEMVDWVQCGRCDQWFHCACMEIDSDDQEQILYFQCGCIQ